jgi:tetratricopeptide (TPR) repeat protein
LTPSFDAYRKFVEANQHNDAGDVPGAARLAREAIVLDTGFATAWHILGLAYGNLGMIDSSRRALGEAARRRSRLSPGQQLLVEARLTTRHADRIRALDELLQISPHASGALNSRGLALMYLGRYEEALQSFELASAAGPFVASPIIRSNHGLLLSSLGRVQEAKPVVEALSGPLREIGAIHLAIASAAWETVDGLATALRKNPSSTPVMRIRASMALASAQAARGRLREAIRYIDEAESTSLQAQVGSSSPGYPRLLLALASESGVRGPLRAAAGDTNTDDRIVRGIWSALLGDVRGARQARDLARTRGIDPGFGTWRDLQGLEAVLAASRGDWSSVTRTLAGVAREGGGMQGSRVYGGGIVLRRWLVADAYERLGKLDSAATFFEQVATSYRLSWMEHLPKGLASTFAHRRLARIYTRLREPAMARQHWASFLEMFSDPDPDVTWMVKEAREELTKLTESGAER